MSKKRIKEMQQPNLAEAVPPPPSRRSKQAVWAQQACQVALLTDSPSLTKSSSLNACPNLSQRRRFSQQDHALEEKEESSEAAEPTAQEQVKALLESPHTPDCVRWNFYRRDLEEFFARLGKAKHRTSQRLH